jgi:phosphatidylglycerophosphate synthase
VRRVQVGPVAGFVGTLVLLGSLAVSVACAALALAMARHGAVGLGPADRVTLTRTVLTCGVAALTADSFSGPVSVPVLVLLASVALVLDAVDGRLARATGTASSLGARFDMEADAFLILVLSLYVAPAAGWWVLGIGLARYAFVGSGWVLPWLRGTLPPRYWCKVVAAAQGVVLTVAASGVLPSRVSTAALVVALALLVESFGR